MSRKILISAIIPVFNEGKNLQPLFTKLKKGLNQVDRNYEIIFINDGSTDKSGEILKKIHRKNPQAKVVLFDRNYGKIAALDAGVSQAKGEWLIFLDSDLQNDPLEIPKLFQKAEKGYDVVIGWRQKRKDHPHRLLFSRVVNLLVFLSTRFKAHDYYSPFKIYRHSLVKKLNLRGDLFRFVPHLAFQAGFKVAEIPVGAYSRYSGKSQSIPKLLKIAFTDFLILLKIKKTIIPQYKIKEKLISRN